jgi:hypothetical protein
MIKKLLPVIIMAFIACEKESNEFQFDYKISRNYTIDGIFGDSLIYYYNADNQLLRVDRFYSSDDVSEYYVEYKVNYIKNWNGNYMLSSNGLITSVNNSGNLTELEYESDNIVYKKQSINNFVSQENFYKYQNGNLIKDSIVIYHEDSEPAITVYKYEYTDSLLKDFMIDYSGLYEIPLTSKNLLKQAESLEHGILYKYSYEISENELIQYADFYDTFHNTKNETTKTIYKLIEK